MNEIITRETREIEEVNKAIVTGSKEIEEKMVAAFRSAVSPELAKLVSGMEKQKEQNRIFEEDIKSANKKIKTTNEKFDKLQKEVNVLGSPIHKRNLRHFKNISMGRVREVLGNDKSTCQYVLFARRFHKKIYADIAYKFQIATYGDIDMEDWKNSDSQFSQAKHMAETWLPAGCYVDEVVTELCNSDKNGLLSPQQHNALKQYLALTNNGKTNPFK